MTHVIGSTETLSDPARQILSEQADNQLAFYESVASLFWKRVKRWGLDDNSTLRSGSSGWSVGDWVDFD